MKKIFIYRIQTSGKIINVVNIHFLAHFFLFICNLHHILTYDFVYITMENKTEAVMWLGSWLSWANIHRCKHRIFQVYRDSMGIHFQPIRKIIIIYPKNRHTRANKRISSSNWETRNMFILSEMDAKPIWIIRIKKDKNQIIIWKVPVSICKWIRKRKSYQQVPQF